MALPIGSQVLRNPAWLQQVVKFDQAAMLEQPHIVRTKATAPTSAEVASLLPKAIVTFPSTSDEVAPFPWGYLWNPPFPKLYI